MAHASIELRSPGFGIVFDFCGFALRRCLASSFALARKARSSFWCSVDAAMMASICRCMSIAGLDEHAMESSKHKKSSRNEPHLCSFVRHGQICSTICCTNWCNSLE